MRLGDIEDAARTLRSFLERNRSLDELPFAYSRLFPKNCCEATSYLLASLLEERFGLSDVQVIDAVVPGTDEHHFWVETGGRVYDLTADQFAGQEPIVGAEATPLADRFAERRRVDQRRYFDRSEVRRLLADGFMRTP